MSEPRMQTAETLCLAYGRPNVICTADRTFVVHAHIVRPTQRHLYCRQKTRFSAEQLLSSEEELRHGKILKNKKTRCSVNHTVLLEKHEDKQKGFPQHPLTAAPSLAEWALVLQAQIEVGRSATRQAPNTDRSTSNGGDDRGA